MLSALNHTAFTGFVDSFTGVSKRVRYSRYNVLLKFFNFMSNPPACTWKLSMYAFASEMPVHFTTSSMKNAFIEPSMYSWSAVQRSLITPPATSCLSQFTRTVQRITCASSLACEPHLANISPGVGPSSLPIVTVFSVPSKFNGTFCSG